MARVEYSALINRLTGKLGGSTFQLNGAGSVVRANVYPVYRNSPYQSEVKIYNAAIRNSWKSLTTSQRQAWAAWRNWYGINYSNDSSMPKTAYNVFRKCNYYRVAAGMSINTAPSYTAIVNPPLYYVGQETLSSVSLEFDRSIVTESEGFVIRATPLLPNTKLSGWSKCRTIPEVIIDANTVDLEIGYVNRFGQTPAGGERILMQYLTFDLATGVPYKYQRIIFTVE